MTLRLATQAVDSQRTISSTQAVDRRDLDALYRAHYGHVLRLCLRMSSGHRAWAEDIAQDVFLHLHQRPGLLDDVENVRAWLTTLTVRRCLARLRRDRFLQAAPVRWLVRSGLRVPATPESRGIVDETLRKAAEAVHNQPPKVRAAFFLYFVDQMTVVEIGEVLGHSKGYVSKLLARARRAIEQEDLQ